MIISPGRPAPDLAAGLYEALPIPVTLFFIIYSCVIFHGQPCQGFAALGLVVYFPCLKNQFGGRFVGEVLHNIFRDLWMSQAILWGLYPGISPGSSDISGRVTSLTGVCYWVFQSGHNLGSATLPSARVNAECHFRYSSLDGTLRGLASILVYLNKQCLHRWDLVPCKREFMS